MDDIRIFCRRTFIFGAASAAVGVVLGSFAAHGLKGQLTTDMLSVFETGVRYQMYHAFALMMTALAASLFGNDRTAGFQVAAWGFGLGTVFFCASLYLLSIVGMTWLGAITPLGGVGFLVGWSALVVAVLRGR